MRPAARCRCGRQRLRRVGALHEVLERSEGLAFSYWRDAATRFSTPHPIVGISGGKLGFNGSQQGMLLDKLAVRGAGSVAIVNSTFAPGEGSHIWLLRGALPPR